MTLANVAPTGALADAVRAEFVNHLGRAPSVEELTRWVRARVADEFRNHVGRDPTDDELDNWVAGRVAFAPVLLEDGAGAQASRSSSVMRSVAVPATSATAGKQWLALVVLVVLVLAWGSGNG